MRLILSKTAPLVLLGIMCLAQSPAPNPVLRGDHPDPSVIRIGNKYWAANTSAEWSPIYPIYSSTDLKTWTPESAVFYDPPPWASSNFWAPELTLDQGHVRVYYAARQRGGPLCVGVATAEDVKGPYTDHGPMVCQPDGSIDPAFVRDEHGKPYLIWKEDGNSQNKPTSIFAQPTTPDGLKLTGEAKELIRNDAAWEGKVVEAPYIFRRSAWFFMFYAGGACCGVKCDYGVGIARAKSLLGPWEKDPGNPIVTDNAQWRCPGHGTAVSDPKGNLYFLYHSYSRQGSIYVGRESVLDQVTWNADGWPSINAGQGPSGTSEVSTAFDEKSDFTGSRLSPTWQWPITHKPSLTEENGTLTLSPGAESASDPLGAIVAQSAEGVTFTAAVELRTDDLIPGETAGLAIIGDERHAAGIAIRSGNLIQWQRDEIAWRTLAASILSDRKPIHLRIQSKDARLFTTYYSLDGSTWTTLGGPIDVSAMPPWDRGLRVGVTCGGTAGAKARFQGFQIRVGE